MIAKANEQHHHGPLPGQRKQESDDRDGQYRLGCQLDNGVDDGGEKLRRRSHIIYQLTLLTVNEVLIVGLDEFIKNLVLVLEDKSGGKSGPEVYGDHNIFVDNEFNVAVFLPKADKTLHVLLGDVLRAKRWIKFDSNGEKILDRNLSVNAHEWKINPKKIYYRGEMLSIDNQVLSGKVVKAKDFNEKIDDSWIKSMKDEFMEFMRKQDLRP